MCEALMERALADTPNVIVVTSAGLNATPGRPAHPWAVDAARELGISLEHHRARLLTADMLERTDVVFVMDCQNKVQLLTRNPTMSEKVIMLGSYAGRSYGSMEIVDPYYEGEEGTRRCYGILQTCIRNLVIELLANAEATNK
jgi:protein-tyrosine phosphatase